MKKKKVSLFYTLLTLVAMCVIVVIYVSSSIQINKLAVGNNLLKEEIKRRMQANDLLVADIEKLSSFERISSLAGTKLSLKYKESSITERRVVLKKSDIQKTSF